MTERYKNGKIYRIVCNQTGLQYIGSTCKQLHKRMWDHKACYKSWVKGEYGYISSFEVIKGGDYTIVLVEDYPCERKEQLMSRERYYIETMTCVNRTMPISSIEQTKQKQKEYYLENIERLRELNKEYHHIYGKLYREKNKEYITERRKKFYEENKDKFKEKNKDRYEKNKEVISAKRKQDIYDCECGSSILKTNRAQHFKTKKHLDHIGR